MGTIQDRVGHLPPEVIRSLVTIRVAAWGMDCRAGEATIQETLNLASCIKDSIVEIAEASGLSEDDLDELPDLMTGRSEGAQDTTNMLAETLAKGRLDSGVSPRIAYRGMILRLLRELGPLTALEMRRANDAMAMPRANLHAWSLVDLQRAGQIVKRADRRYELVNRPCV